MSDTQTRCGYVALLGRPNVGKSTLLNELVGYRVAAIANKPQTTRGQIQGVVTQEAFQVIFIDTPGIHKEEKSLMNKAMNAAAMASLDYIDVAAFVVEAGSWRKGDDLVLSKLTQQNVPVILVINKIDRLQKKHELLGYIDEIRNKHAFAEIVPVSAKNKDNLDALLGAIARYLPESEFIYPEDHITDKPLRFIVAELIREQIMRRLEQEVPYSAAVEIESFEEHDSRVDISAVIWIERPGQKGILIGKQGQMLKTIGAAARKSIEGILEKQVFLKLWVKVSENWQNDAKRLRYLGME